MARQTLDRAVKYKRLIRVLDMPRPHVRGYLETMWDVAHECGNPFFACAEDVEAAAEWEGKPGALFAALVACGWIDADGSGWSIHDYWDHAPEYVRKRRFRELQRQNTGDTLNGTADNGGQRTTTAENGKPPTPTPSPTPTHLLQSQDLPKASPVGGKRVDEFEMFWHDYPRKVARGRAEKAWKATAKVRPALDSILSSIARAKLSDQWSKDGGTFIPHPATWLNAQGWADEPLIGASRNGKNGNRSGAIFGTGVTDPETLAYYESLGEIHGIPEGEKH